MASAAPACLARRHGRRHAGRAASAHQRHHHGVVVVAEEPRRHVKGPRLPPGPHQVPPPGGGGVLLLDHVRVRHRVRVPGPEHWRVRVPSGADDGPVHGDAAAVTGHVQRHRQRRRTQPHLRRRVRHRAQPGVRGHQQQPRRRRRQQPQLLRGGAGRVLRRRRRRVPELEPDQPGAHAGVGGLRRRSHGGHRCHGAGAAAQAHEAAHLRQDQPLHGHHRHGDTAYVGFSSASSMVLVKQYVLGWSFSLGGAAAPALDYAKLPKLPRIGPKLRSKALTVALPIATTAAVFAAVAVGFLLLRRRLRYAELHEDWEMEFGPHRFAYKDLYDATGGFKEKRLLGVGGFGRVYRGVLPGSQSEVAVKKVSHESRQGMKEFVAEVVSIGRLRHRNLVQLLGYCRRKGELLLVYNYMPNGSLDKHLHYHDEDKPVLNWAQRLRIIRGVAAGLLYVHEDWEKVVIHRDIKASNVLLDGEMNGRLGDFGLARLYDHGVDPRSTRVVGTMGYLAPELVRTGKATARSDVFAFGVFVLEVACGRRPVEEDDDAGTSAGGDCFVLVDWVLGLWREGCVTGVVDARVRSGYDAMEADLVLRLGLACLHLSPAARPSMRQVKQYLDGSAPLPEELPATFGMFEGTEKQYQPLFDSWYVWRPTSPPVSVATMSDIGLSGGR